MAKARSDSWRAAEGRPVAQYLLDGCGEPSRIGSQLGGSGRVLVEREDGVAEESGRGDVVREQEQPDESDELLVVESFPVPLDAHQLAREIVGERARRRLMCASR
jgi:hypothetical protein